jgi:hypothetical protein
MCPRCGSWRNPAVAIMGLRDAAEIRDILERDWAVERDAG